MEGVIDAGVQRERKRDLWEPLIQGPANAHIHEDLELPLQLQRSLLCFPLRMPSSTPNTVRSLFLSFPSPHSPPSIPPFLSRSLLFSASVHLLILCSFLPTNWRACLFYLFICFSPLFSFILFSFFCHLSPLYPSLSLSLSLTHSLTLSVSLSGVFASYRSFWMWTAVPCETSRCLLSVRCRVSELMTVYFARNYSCTPIHRGKRLMHNVSL